MNRFHNTCSIEFVSKVIKELEVFSTLQAPSWKQKAISLLEEKQSKTNVFTLSNMKFRCGQLELTS